MDDVQDLRRRVEELHQNSGASVRAYIELSEKFPDDEPRWLQAIGPKLQSSSHEELLSELVEHTKAMRRPGVAMLFALVGIGISAVAATAIKYNIKALDDGKPDQN